MKRKLNDLEREVIIDMRKKGVSVTEVSKKLDVPIRLIAEATWVRRKGYDSMKEYNKARVRERLADPDRVMLGRLIKQRSQELGYSYESLAREINVSRTSISEYFTGASKPRGNTEPKLLQALSLPYETLDEYLKAERAKSNKSL